MPPARKGLFLGKVILCLMLSSCVFSCSPRGEVSEKQPTQQQTAVISEKISTTGGVFQVDAWVDNHNPQKGEPIMLYGSLIKHGHRLGGMMMEAYWPGKDQSPRLPDCTVQVNYGSGMCKVDTEHFLAGVPTTLRVEFDYNENTYAGSIEITPH